MSDNVVGCRIFRGCLVALVMVIGACGPQSELEEVGVQEAPIVGGTRAPDGAHPTVGAFVINFFGAYQSFCTGTVISPRFMLTAAHCLTSPEIQGQPFGVYFGSSVSGANAGNVIPVESTHPHPNFRYTTMPPGDLHDWYDIGLVKLAADAPMPPMKMLRPDQAGATYRLTAEAWVAGYGLTDPRNMFSSGTKYEGYMQLADVGNSEMFLTHTSRGVPCQGDSGGPTFLKAGEEWRLVGVTSRGDETCTYVSIQTRADAYLDWIHGIATDVICDSGNNSTECTPTPPPSTKKGFGAFCGDPKECEAAICATIGDASRCSVECDLQAPQCPGGAKCVAVNDTTAICVGEGWDRGGMGSVCEQPEDCASGLCAELGEAAFCTVLCDPSTGCGDDGITCEQVGADTHVCVPRDDGGDGGGCHVSAGEGAWAFAVFFLIALWTRRRC